MKMQVMLILVILIASGCAAPEAGGEATGADAGAAENSAGAEQEIPQETAEREERAYAISPLFTPLRGCEEKNPRFSYSPIDMDVIAIIEPQGELTDRTSGHITPGDHIGIQYPKTDGPHKLYAMADGYIVRMERQPRSSLFGLSDDVENLHVYFEYSCSLLGSYVHVTKLTEEILSSSQRLKEFYTKPRPANTESIYERIPVKAGQQIGEVQGFGLLGMLTVDTEVTLSGFISPEIYEGEPWKIHAVAPFDYFNEPIRSQLIAKNARKEEPRGGKIDFDVPERLAGNWFLEGTDYSGNQKNQGYCGDYLCPYWDTHLAFVYDFVDHGQIRVSVGYDAGIAENGPYGAKGNSPDPKDVSLSSGMVKYELVGLKDVDREFNIISQGKPIHTEGSGEVVGTMLVQMREDDKIQVEVFPGKTASQTDSFTGKSMVYWR